jgi:hypothetical protein
MDASSDGQEIVGAAVYSGGIPSYSTGNRTVRTVIELGTFKA